MKKYPLRHSAFHIEDFVQDILSRLNKKVCLSFHCYSRILRIIDHSSNFASETSRISPYLSSCSVQLCPFRSPLSQQSSHQDFSSSPFHEVAGDFSSSVFDESPHSLRQMFGISLALGSGHSRRHSAADRPPHHTNLSRSSMWARSRETTFQILLLRPPRSLPHLRSVPLATRDRALFPTLSLSWLPYVSSKRFAAVMMMLLLVEGFANYLSRRPGYLRQYGSDCWAFPVQQSCLSRRGVVGQDESF